MRMTARSIEINTAFVLKKLESNPYDDNQTDVTILGIHPERDVMVNLLVSDFLPKKMIGWSMRYQNWSQETYDTILKIVPELPNYSHYTIHKCEEEYMDEAEYHLSYTDWGKCGDDSNEPDLTHTQREALYRVLGASWYPSRHTELHYVIEEMALVPMVKKGYGK
jgi:hypothetical protein